MTDAPTPRDVLAGVKWFHNADIMGMWDRWRRYIAEGGRASWPRDAFESLLDTHDAEVEALRAQLTRCEAACFDVQADNVALRRTIQTQG